MKEFDRPLKCPYCGCTTLTREEDVEWFAPEGAGRIVQVDSPCKCRSCGTSFTIHTEKRKVEEPCQEYVKDKPCDLPATVTVLDGEKTRRLCPIHALPYQLKEDHGVL